MKQQLASGRTALEIARSLERAIHDGRAAAGTALPTVRDLAASLGVSPATVAAAYRVLHSRGLLAGDRRRGTRVRDHAHVHAAPAPAGPPAALEGAIDLASGNPDPELLPSLDGALHAVPATPALYDAPSELRSLVAFAKAEFAADGVAVSELLVTSGALDAIERILREHLRVGDRVLVEDPGFPPLLHLLAAAGLVPEPLAMDEQGVRPDALEAALRRQPRAAIVTPRAQNPTGAAFTATRVADLRRLLDSRPELLVIENDPFGPVAGSVAVTLTSAREHWALVRSTSKFLGPDLRVALVAGDETTVARVRGRQALGARRVSRILQHIALALWSDPSSGRHLARVADIYAQRRTALVTALAAHDIAVSAVSGFNVWISVRHEAATVHSLAERGWAVAAGERFRLRSGAGIRVTTSALDAADAPRLAADIATASRHRPPALA